ncbi:GntR family transcriptional regulator [Microlunatus flavus]|uniref:DNA-binding transcriptional regulator, GntR family n=1 Tax=Microlunatus flavus TaxID=1036181 RepID=A0A1H9A9K9_9ACTN|nr:GntR family transcriptional regulator [Microlunatus flavus]SEP73422.1 DNA-binding transcriptional regulator, GntR family [Microlunatus flavus]
MTILGSTTDERPALRPDAVYAALREAIIGLHHLPGSTLTELSVCSTYQVARPTARVAIQRLVDDGLLRRDAHRSARVPELTSVDVHDLYGVRVGIEEAALRAIASSGAPHAQALEIHARFSSSAFSVDQAPFVKDDIAFHRALVVASGSSRLRRMHELIMGEIELCMGQLQHHHLMSARTVADEHQGILDAVAIGDVELTAALVRAHILSARNRLLARFASLDERTPGAGRLSAASVGPAGSSPVTSVGPAAPLA